MRGGYAQSVNCLNPWDAQSIRQYSPDGVFSSLNAGTGGGQNRAGVCYALQGNGIDRKIENGCNGKGFRENEMYTLDVVDRHAVVYESKSAMDENWHEAEVKNAIRANASKSSHAIVYSIDPLSSNSMKSSNPHSGFHQQDVAKCLDTSDGNPSKNQGGMCVVYDTTQITSPDNWSNPHNGDPCHPLAAQQHPPLAVYGVDCRNGVLNEEISGTLQAKPNGGYSLNFTNPVLYSTEGANEDL